MSDPITQDPTGKFFAGNGASINRLNDRLFVGGATANDGAYPNVEKDWLTTYQATLSPVVAPVVSSQAAILGPTSGDCGAGLTVGIQSRDMGAYGAAIGVESFAINNNTTVGNINTGFAFYGEAHRGSEAASNTYAAEFQVANFGNTVVVDPYSAPSGGTFGLQVGAGCGLDGSGQSSVSAAMTITRNPQTFHAGIVFCDGAIPTGQAIIMPHGHSIYWYTGFATVGSSVSGDSAGTLTVSGSRIALAGPVTAMLGIQATGYKSADGSPGVSGTFKTVIVKNGIVVGGSR